MFLRKLLEWFSHSTTTSTPTPVLLAGRFRFEPEDDIQYDMYRDRVEAEAVFDDHGYPLISIGKDTDT